VPDHLVPYGPNYDPASGKSRPSMSSRILDPAFFSESSQWNDSDKWTFYDKGECSPNLQSVCIGGLLLQCVAETGEMG
jgi:outer membrane usher protein FimD/PapC